MLLLLITSITVRSQVLHQNIFPSLSNQVLFDKIIQTFKVSKTLEYGQARDTLYAKIDLVSDSLECIYSGWKIYISPGSDPTQAAFSGPGGGINAEHAYPQSKGATGIAKSDMHILYPSRVIVNSSRLSNPLLEIADIQTKKWFIKDREQSIIPPPNMIDGYSEANEVAFEPREQSKGNLARSIFYFYTMYRDQAEIADPNFFEIQKSTLCNWHNYDPVDSIEWNRTWGIAKYQENKPNPFVLDCSLVSRLYCNNIDQACEELVQMANSTKDHNPTDNIQVFPNPFDNLFNVHSLNDLGICQLKLIDMYGREVWKDEIRIQVGNNIVFPNVNLNPAIYILMFKDNMGRETSELVRKK
jgi:hypothetical protein